MIFKISINQYFIDYLFKESSDVTMRPSHDNKKRHATNSMLTESDELIAERKGNYFL